MTSMTSDQDIIKDFVNSALWAVCLTYHFGLKHMSDAAIFQRDVLFDILYTILTIGMIFYNVHSSKCTTIPKKKQ